MKQTKNLLRGLEVLKGPFQSFYTDDLPESPSDFRKINWRKSRSFNRQAE
ncbi:hypothetical protein [Virgibacillus halotolerans]|nr:hypothetical protein [Virgibacillus halotolerans]